MVGRSFSLIEREDKEQREGRGGEGGEKRREIEKGRKKERERERKKERGREDGHHITQLNAVGNVQSYESRTFSIFEAISDQRRCLLR